MRVHPAPLPLRRYDGGARQKNLRRLPHIFAKVLELPFHSDADVSVEETINCFRFIAGADDISGEVRADTVEIYPGVTKIVIRGSDFAGGELEIDTWRFRLPETTRPEMATAEYREGVLMVTVPKGAEEEEEVVEERERGGFGAGRLVLVQ